MHNIKQKTHVSGLDLSHESNGVILLFRNTSKTATKLQFKMWRHQFVHVLGSFGVKNHDIDLKFGIYIVHM